MVDRKHTLDNIYVWFVPALYQLILHHLNPFAFSTAMPLVLKRC